jgi:hypothetical protein
MSVLVVPIDIGGNVVLKPSENDVAHYGPRRMVKLVPLPGNHAAPAIWTSPYTFEDDDLKAKCHHVIVLMSKEPLPETMRVTLPVDFLAKLPEVPCEW